MEEEEVVVAEEIVRGEVLTEEVVLVVGREVVAEDTVGGPEEMVVLAGEVVGGEVVAEEVVVAGEVLAEEVVVLGGPNDVVEEYRANFRGTRGVLLLVLNQVICVNFGNCDSLTVQQMCTFNCNSSDGVRSKVVGIQHAPFPLLASHI